MKIATQKNNDQKNIWQQLFSLRDAKRKGRIFGTTAPHTFHKQFRNLIYALWKPPQVKLPSQNKFTATIAHLLSRLHSVVVWCGCELKNSNKKNCQLCNMQT